jgi:hypothetical protein
MDGGCLKDAGEQVIPEAFDLHILPADQAKIHQHIQSDQQLDDAPRILIFLDIQEDSERDGAPDVAEVEKIKKIVLLLLF